MYAYVPVCTCTYWHVQVCTLMKFVHNSMYLYVLVHTSMYKYMRVHTRTYCSLPFLKKVQTDLEPAILCIPRTEFTPALRGYRPQCLWKLGMMLVFISSVSVKLLVRAPGGWWWIDGAGPAAPPPPAMTSPARAWTWISWMPSCAWKQGLERAMCCRRTELENLIRKRQWLDSCQVFSTQHWAILSCSWVAWIHASLRADHWNWNRNCCHQYLWPGPQCHVSSESDCQASKQNYFGGRLNFRRRRREVQVVTTCVWAGSSFLKPLEHLKRYIKFDKMLRRGHLPSLER